jgi:3-oxoacyl-(acyl-carrier-protein) synthase
MEYITASCVIRNHRIYLDGGVVWEQPPPAGPTGGPSGSLADFLLACYQYFEFQYPKFYKMDQLSKLGWLAAELLLSKGFAATEYAPEDMAVVLSNASSSLDTDYRYFATAADIPSPALFVYTLPNIMIGEICIRHKFKGENAFFIMESFDPVFIGTYVRDLIETGNARACICGWVEVLGEAYTAALFLIENKFAGLPFTAENMNRLFNQKYPA